MIKASDITEHQSHQVDRVARRLRMLQEELKLIFYFNQDEYLEIVDPIDGRQIGEINRDDILPRK